MTTYPRTLGSIGASASLSSAAANTLWADMLAHFNNLIGGVDDYDRLIGKTESLTIAAGVVTASKNYMIVDTEAAASTDDLTTINGYGEGRVLHIRMSNAARVVTLKHNTGAGQPNLWGGADVVLSATRWLKLIGTAAGWSDSFSPANAGAAPAMFINTARTALGANAASQTISSIPATYKHLLLCLECRTDAAGTADNIILQFNADTTAANYYTQYAIGAATAFTLAEFLGATKAGVLLPNVAAGSTGSAGLGHVWVFITNYTSTTLRRNVVAWGGAQAGTTTGLIKLGLCQGNWINVAAAISSLTFKPDVGANLVAPTAWTLYGLN